MSNKITKLEVQNFKTFDHIKLKLRNLNIIIGLNAAGKSNFIAVFRFLRDIVNDDLDNAISLQGGIEYLLNSKNGIKKNLIIDLEFSIDEEYLEVPLKVAKPKIEELGINIPNFDETPKSLFIQFKKANYYFELNFSETQDYTIKQDILKSFGIVFIADESKDEDGENVSIKFKNKSIIGDIQFNSTFLKGYLDFQINGTINESFKKLIVDILSPRRPIKIPEKTLILQASSFLDSAMIEYILRKLAIFDIDPRVSKRSGYISGKKELEEDGGNLALTIKNIIKDKKRGEEFYTLVNDLLPFVDGFEVEPIAGKNLILKMKERYNDDYWPATFLSDGTVNVISLIVATNFEEKVKPLKIFEEPEKNIHPSLIPKILQLFKDASKESQLIVTSHNPEFVKHADIHDILFIKRDNNGYSQINRPLNFKKVKTFLKSDMGLNELFTRDLIGE